MRQLPARITAAAFQASNGEYAWRRSNIVEALQAIAQSNQAILGGEVWAIVGGRIMGLIPSALDEPPGVWHWETAARQPNEAWPEYCRRTARESIATVEAMQVAKEARVDLREHLFFNVTFIAEGDD